MKPSIFLMIATLLSIGCGGGGARSSDEGSTTAASSGSETASNASTCATPATESACVSAGCRWNNNACVP